MYLSTKLKSKSRFWLTIEFLVLFIGIPSIVYFDPTRAHVRIGILSAAAYALFKIITAHKISWKELWHGVPWPIQQRKIALLRFLIAAPLIILFTYVVVPERLFAFPTQRPGFWLLVMVLYPILSVIPQELVFRSFFFRRYEQLFRTPLAMIAASAFVFGYVHIVFQNLVSPTFCLIGGLIFAYSYTQHRSLKWAVVEHAAYGCFVFTVGIGFYFLVGGFKP